MTKQTQKQSSKEIKSTQKATPEAGKPQSEEADKKQPIKVTKKAMVQDLLKQENGATIEDIANKTGWQHHTVRGHLSMLKKAGQTIISEEKDGKRRYKIKTDTQKVKS
tara:strand:+ start:153 stop:476 length:324 start_codon:yes stop_codon:yes gene_type:complete